MKLTMLVCLTLAVWLGTAAVQAKTADNNAARTYTVRSVSPSTSASAVLNLRDFGAVGDGATDDGPVLQNALNALGQTGGGTLFVPAGRYAISTPVQKDFTGLAFSVTILGVASLTPVPPPTATGDELSRGLNLVSEFLPRTGEQGIALTIAGLQTFLIADIAFVGTPEVITDAFITLNLYEIDDATVRHCEFYGLSTQVGPGIVNAVLSSLTVEQSAFLGSTAASGIYGSIVQNIQWKGISVTDTAFVDYGQRPELLTKTGLSAPFSWVNLGNAAALRSDSPRREAVISNVFLDEGGFVGLSSFPSRYEPPSAPIDLLYVTGVFMNVSNLGTTGHYLRDVQRVLIEKSHYGWSHNTDSAISLLSVGNAILDQVECVDSANRIRADAATAKLTVIDSVYTFLDSQAPETKVVTTETPEDDPVQYVRQEFNATLGRVPDPAAHFYWSNLLLQCDEDGQCIAGQREALTAYLSTAPAPSFSISGAVTDESGVPVSGVVITLGGSQSVTTQTGADGTYSFAKLPTSGVYTVTPSQVNYTFDASSRTITTPNGDQTSDFSAIPNTFEFNATSYSVNESSRTITVSVDRTGDTENPAEVTYSAVDGSAQQRSDVIPVIGRLSFAAGETSQTFIIFITNDSYVEGDESLTLELSDMVGGMLGNNSTATLTIIDNDSSETGDNPIDGARFFVRQHYRDFLNRLADSDGLDFWSAQISSCGTDATCIADRRMNVSAAFFLSIEFQQTGFLVYRLYQAAYAQPPAHLDEFLLDTRTIGEGLVVNAPGWQELLEANKTTLIEDFVGRPRFIEAYPDDLTPALLVNRLNATAGNTLSGSDIAAAVAEFAGATTSENRGARARVLRRVAESEDFSRRQTNPAFVMMQYFGYLQRNPNESPDNNLDGYNFWLQKLDEFDGDFRRAEMVKSFLVSGEYRARFGTP